MYIDIYTDIYRVYRYIYIIFIIYENNMLSQFSQQYLRGNSFTRASRAQVLELLQSHRGDN